MERHGDSAGVVTADADGQHSVGDCVMLAKALMADGDAVHIGSRDFSLGKIPFRSWIGNRWSSLSFAIVLGRWLPDTQTGLRAFPASLLPALMSVAGERYEYEMGVLMTMVRRGVQIRTPLIRTIYENGNACSHFSPIRDTIRINRLVLADFFRFAGVSVASFVLDQGLAWAFAFALHMAGVERAGVIWASGFAARLVSSIFNFSLNRSFVFRSGCGIGSAAWKYALLCLLVIMLSNAGVTVLSFAGVPRGAAKFVCDILLYFVGYNVQSKLIFKRCPPVGL
jgi:dolichol-phosphate mannosyltransferase